MYTPECIYDSINFISFNFIKFTKFVYDDEIFLITDDNSIILFSINDDYKFSIKENNFIYDYDM